MINVNYLAIIIAVIVANAIGFLYYGKIVQKRYMKILNDSKDKNQHEMNEMGKIYGINFVVTLVTAYVLAHLIAMSSSYFGYSLIQSGVTTAFFVWLGFVVPGQLNDNFFGKKPYELVVINAIYQLLALVAMGIVIGYLK